MKSRKDPSGGRKDRPHRRPQGKPGGYGRQKEDAERPKKDGRPLAGSGSQGEPDSQPKRPKSGAGRASGSKARQEIGRKANPPKPGGGKKVFSGTPYAGKGSKPLARTNANLYQTRPSSGKGFVSQGKGSVPPAGGRPFLKRQRLDAPPSKIELGRLMSLYGVALPAKTLDKLWAYHQLLRKNNGDQDLTRLIGFDTIAQRHYADCMILHGMMRGKWPSPLVDVGSGAGFPGIMIKLMSPATTIVLAEPRPRRVKFLEMVIQELGLKDITVFGHKVTSRSLTQPFAGVITRAFETLESTLPRLGGCLGVGGQAIFMKGPKVAEEMAHFNNPEYKVLRNQAYRIPNTIQDRVLVILERTHVPAAGEANAFDPAEEADFAEPDSGDE
jgi:16S rRNA (guanine527-N7)-methyltransferase